MTNYRGYFYCLLDSKKKLSYFYFYSVTGVLLQ